MKRFLAWIPIVLTGFFLLFSNSNHLYATHLMGGSITYEYLGMVGTDQSYKVTLKIYRYCDATAGGTAPLDPFMDLYMYLQDPSDPTGDKIWFRTESIPLVSSSFITPPSVGVNCSFSSTVCVEEGIFEMDVLVPPDPGGYHLIIERCCRNGNIANLSTPGSLGQTYYCFLPPTPIINSSPQFNDIPVPFICAGDTVTIVNNAYDPDGDSLVYSFETPYSDYSIIGTDPYSFPIPPVLYNPGYSMTSPFGAGGYNNVDPITGLTKYYIPNQGFFVVAIEIKEYRNGVLIAMIRRDLQLIAIACPVNSVPQLSYANGSGQLNYTITEGQTLCFPVTFTDSNGDSLYLTKSGQIFNSSFVNPPASLPNANGDGIVTSQFCWSTECGMARSAPYQFTVSVLDNGCPPKISNQVYSIKVNPSPLPPAPSVTIMQNPPGTICMGTAVTFTALPTFGGTNPVYQWQLNGVNVGGNSNTYSSSTLNNGDVVTVSLTSNSVCVSAFNAVSPPLIMVVNPFSAPAVSISQLPSGSFCAGTNVTFTALPVNPGPTPVYQWTVNGLNVGTNSPVFSSTTLSIGSQVAVSLTADPGCPSAESNIINVTVNPVLTPDVNITSDNNGAICPGETVTFQAFPTNGGIAPVYQWQVNGLNVGVNSNTYSSSSLVNGDDVQVILTSNENCLTSPSASSNTISIAVTAPTNASVSIAANPAGPVCEDDNIVFTATPVNGGTTPVYQWQINGAFIGVNSQAYATSTLNNGDQVSVVLTSSLNCLSSATANSNVITVTVNPLLSLTSTITVSPSIQFCDGTPVTFTSNTVNGGSNPFYQWQVNGVNVGTNSNTFTSSTLNDGDRVRVFVTSNLNCVFPLTATSNQIVVDVLPTVTPSVSIVSNPSGPVCEGTLIFFTATPVLGGTSPSYQWTVNGNPVGANSATFISGALTDGDIVRVVMNSNAVCPLPAFVNSNQIVTDIIPAVVPDVTISTTANWPVCDGSPVTFTAAGVNTGITPVYQWQVNGVLVGGNSTSITLSNLMDGDSIRVRMLSNAQCGVPLSVFSTSIVAEVLPYLTPALAITMIPSTPVCSGQPATVISNTVNGGSAPVYQWFLNSNPVANNADTLQAVFADGDVVQAVLTSSYQCPSPLTDTSNLVTAQVLPNLTPAISISVNPSGPVCPGDLLTFDATPVNGGILPSYNWTVNGSPVGGNNPFLFSSVLSDGDVVQVELTSTETCLTSPNAFSNVIQVQISNNIVPDVTITVTPSGSVCDGDSLSFSLVSTGGGPNPVMAWRVNGVPVGITGNIFISTSLNNNDVVDVIMESSAFCALPLTDTSNKIVANIDPLLVPSTIITADPPGQFCDGVEITYSATANNEGLNPGYNWLLNGTPVGAGNDTLISSDFLNGDTLQLILTSSERCLAFNPALSNTIVIDRLPPLEALISGPDEVCDGKEITIEVQGAGGTGGPYYFDWDQGLGSGTSFTFIPSQTAIYTVTISDSCSTQRSDSKLVTVNALPEPAFTIEPPQATILNPYFDFVDASLNTSSWLWNFGDGGTSTEQFATHTYLVPGYFTVQLIATSDKGCVDSTYSEVYVENVVTFYIPNSFTPNEDGYNDEFGPIGYSVEGYNLNIFNRWGQSVFNSTGLFDKWNGTDSGGAKLPDGVYVYQLKVLNDPENKIRTGTVTLLR